MRWALALFLLLHGVAHAPGFLVPWRLMSTPTMPYKTTVLDGAVNFGSVGIRALGLLWLLTGVGLIGAAAATISASPRWPAITLGMAALSLLLCIIAWPDSWIGVVLNLLLLGYLWIGGRSGWLPGVGK